MSSDDEDVYEDDDQEVESGFGNIIVVDNLPVVPKEKFEKLEGVIRKIYSQIGVIKEDGLWMPVDPETQKSLGYCFIEYNTPQVLICMLTFSLFHCCEVKFVYDCWLIWFFVQFIVYFRLSFSLFWVEAGFTMFGNLIFTLLKVYC